MSLKTNAKTYSIVLITSLVLVIGLVGLLAFNSPKNDIVAHALATPGTSYDIDNLTLNYSNVSNIFSKPTYRIINAPDNLSVNDYRGLFSFSLAHSSGTIYFPNYAMTTEDYGFYGLSKFVQYRFTGTLKYNDKILVSANPSAQVYFIYSCPVPHYRPRFDWHFYDAGGMPVSNVSSVSNIQETRTNTLIPIQLTCTVPSGAYSYSTSISNNSSYSTMYTYYPYSSGSPTVLTYADKDIGYLIDLYELDPDEYWHTRYNTSQENLRLAQEEGATLTGALEGITTAPINALAEFMTFELPFFNLNLGTILAILVSLLLVGFVIKILITKG